MKLKINDISSLLKCTETGTDIIIKDKIAVSLAGKEYPMSNGILDMVSGEQSSSLLKTGNSYDKISGNQYDRFVSNPFIMKCLWGVNLNKAYTIYDRLNDYPDGIFLDVPAGTGLFSSQLYLSKSESTFVAVDYSMGMLQAAKARCKQADIRNVLFVRADVANLPFKAGSFDGCFSINGFHVFPDPEKATGEIANCLKKDAIMAIIAVCSGERWFSDFILNKIMFPRGLVNRSRTVSEYKTMLGKAGLQSSIEMMGAMMHANCTKL